MKKGFSLKASWQWTYSQVFSRPFTSINNITCSIPSRWHCEHLSAFLCLLKLLCWHEIPATFIFFLHNFITFFLSGFSVLCLVFFGSVSKESCKKGNRVRWTWEVRYFTFSVWNQECLFVPVWSLSLYKLIPIIFGVKYLSWGTSFWLWLEKILNWLGMQFKGSDRKKKHFHCDILSAMFRRVDW